MIEKRNNESIVGSPEPQPSPDILIKNPISLCLFSEILISISKEYPKARAGSCNKDGYVPIFFGDSQ